MAKAKNKTIQTDASVEDFIAAVENDTRRKDAEALLKLFGRVTGMKPKMWGPSLIGYGRYHYKYESGREGDMMMAGFSPRKQNMTLYVMPGFADIGDKLERLGKHKLGKSCLYISKLADIDMSVLEEIIEYDLAYMRENYETWPE